jgi:hypothetical protein
MYTGHNNYPTYFSTLPLFKTVSSLFQHLSIFSNVYQHIAIFLHGFHHVFIVFLSIDFHQFFDLFHYFTINYKQFSDSLFPFLSWKRSGCNADLFHFEPRA